MGSGALWRVGGLEPSPDWVSLGHRAARPMGRGSGDVGRARADRLVLPGQPRLRHGLREAVRSAGLDRLVTQQRIPKQSALWYRDVIAANGLPATAM